MNDWSVFAFVPLRGPILDCVVADSYDQICRVQKCICGLIGYLPNATAEIWKLLARDCSRSLKSSNNRKCRCAKEIANGSAEFWLARHKSEEDHRRFRGIDKTRGFGKGMLRSTSLRNRRGEADRFALSCACHDVYRQTNERCSRTVGFSCAKRSGKHLCGSRGRINFCRIFCYRFTETDRI